MEVESEFFGPFAMIEVIDLANAQIPGIFPAAEHCDAIFLKLSEVAFTATDATELPVTAECRLDLIRYRTSRRGYRIYHWSDDARLW